MSGHMWEYDWSTDEYAHATDGSPIVNKGREHNALVKISNAQEKKIHKLESTLAEMRDLCEMVVRGYNAYRGRGVMPAPDEYQTMVAGVLKLERHLLKQENEP